MSALRPAPFSRACPATHHAHVLGKCKDSGVSRTGRDVRTHAVQRRELLHSLACITLANSFLLGPAEVPAAARAVSSELIKAFNDAMSADGAEVSYQLSRMTLNLASLNVPALAKLAIRIG